MHEGDISLGGGVLYYATTLPLVFSGPLTLALLLLGWRFVRAGRHRGVLLCWLALPVALHVVMVVRNFRYLVGVAPAAALIIAVAVCSLGPRLRATLAAALVGVAAASWLCCSFVGEPWLLREERVPTSPVACLPHAAVPSPLQLALTCGECAFAGPPGGHQRCLLQLEAPLMEGWLHRRNPLGAGALIQLELTNPAAVELMAHMLHHLPRLRVMGSKGVRDQLIYRPAIPPGVTQYLLLRGPLPPSLRTPLIRPDFAPDTEESRGKPFYLQRSPLHPSAGLPDGWQLPANP